MQHETLESYLSRNHHIYMEVSFERQEHSASGSTIYTLLGDHYYLLPYMVAKDMVTLGKARVATPDEIQDKKFESGMQFHTNEELAHAG